MAYGGEDSLYLNYKRASHRVRTFVGWPSDTGQRPEKLAAEGFVYTGRGDTVKCFFCGLPLFAWDATLDPAKVHSEFSEGKCWFANKRMRNDLRSSAFMSSALNGQDSVRVSTDDLSVVYVRARPTDVQKTFAHDPGHDSGEISYDKGKIKLRQPGQFNHISGSKLGDLSNENYKKGAKERSQRSSFASSHNLPKYKINIPDSDLKDDLTVMKGIRTGLAWDERVTRKQQKTGEVESIAPTAKTSFVEGKDRLSLNPQESLRSESAKANGHTKTTNTKPKKKKVPTATLR